MDKQEKNKILTRTRRRFEESNITMPPEEMKWKNEEEKQHVLPQMNLREHP